MWVDVRIPYEQGGRLADAYNRALVDSSADWVLFLDHDVFLANPRWYEMCLTAIESLRDDPKAACIGCLCGGERHKRTMAIKGEPDDRIEKHIELSKWYFQKYNYQLTKSKEYIAGYFMLVNRKIATKIGFLQQNKSINNIDVDFGTRLLEAGYHIYNMPGLYIYHRRGMKHLMKEFV